MAIKALTAMAAFLAAYTLAPAPVPAQAAAHPDILAEVCLDPSDRISRATCRAACDQEATASGYRSGFVRPAPPLEQLVDVYFDLGCTEQNPTHFCLGAPGTGYVGSVPVPPIFC